MTIAVVVSAAATGCDAFADSSRGGDQLAVPPTVAGGIGGRPGIPPFAGMPTGPVACPASVPANGAQCFGTLLCTFTATDPPCGEAAMQLALCWNGVWDVDVLVTRDCGPPVVVPDAGPDEDAGRDEDAGS